MDHVDEQYIKALEARAKELDAELKQVVDGIETDKQFVRRQFIRDAAVRIFVAGMSLDGPRETMTERGERTVVLFTPNTAWRAAVALWDAKPEDC